MQDNKNYSNLNKDIKEILKISDKECIEEQNKQNNEIQPKKKRILKTHMNICINLFKTIGE